jgi:hypothetical protein
MINEERFKMNDGSKLGSKSILSRKDLLGGYNDQSGGHGQAPGHRRNMTYSQESIVKFKFCLYNYLIFCLKLTFHRRTF